MEGMAVMYDKMPGLSSTSRISTGSLMVCSVQLNEIAYAVLTAIRFGRPTAHVPRVR
jgi:hypothetical protein